MKAGELLNVEGKQAKELVILVSTAEARQLQTVVEAAAGAKIKGAKALMKKLDKCLECW